MFRVIGGLFGRIVGRGLVDIIGIDHILGNRYWMWIDPGAFALIGAASFFGGVARLTMSLTVIMVRSRDSQVNNVLTAHFNDIFCSARQKRLQHFSTTAQ